MGQGRTVGKSIATESDATGPETSNVVMNHPRTGYARQGRFWTSRRDRRADGRKFVVAFTDDTQAVTFMKEES